MTLDAQIAEAVALKVASELPALLAEATDTLRAGQGLDDKRSLAAKLKCSPRQIDTLRTKGLPVVMVGDLVRFDFAAVVTWLRARKGQSDA